MFHVLLNSVISHNKLAVNCDELRYMKTRPKASEVVKYVGAESCLFWLGNVGFQALRLGH